MHKYGKIYKMYVVRENVITNMTGSYIDKN